MVLGAVFAVGLAAGFGVALAALVLGVALPVTLGVTLSVALAAALGAALGVALAVALTVVLATALAATFGSVTAAFGKLALGVVFAVALPPPGFVADTLAAAGPFEDPAGLAGTGRLEGVGPFDEAGPLGAAVFAPFPPAFLARAASCAAGVLGCSSPSDDHGLQNRDQSATRGEKKKNEKKEKKLN